MPYLQTINLFNIDFLSYCILDIIFIVSYDKVFSNSLNDVTMFTVTRIDANAMKPTIISLTH